MAEIERLSEYIEWIDLSFVGRKRTPKWGIQVDIRCHLAGMSTRDARQFLEELGVNCSHVAIHNWVHKADLQPISTVSADQLAVNEKVIRINDDNYWLCGAMILRQTKYCSSGCFRRQEVDNAMVLRRAAPPISTQ